MKASIGFSSCVSEKTGEGWKEGGICSLRTNEQTGRTIGESVHNDSIKRAFLFRFGVFFHETWVSSCDVIKKSEMKVNARRGRGKKKLEREGSVQC